MNDAKVKVVEPKLARGYSMTLLQLFGVGPKWHFTCGSCSASFSTRLPIVDEPGVVCPNCGTVNILKKLKWT